MQPATFVNGRPTVEVDGDMTTHLYNDGTPRARGVTRDGVMDGRWEFWKKDGSLWQVGHFLDGVKHGPWTVYRPDGSALQEKTFDHGRVCAPS